MIPASPPKRIATKTPNNRPRPIHTQLHKVALRTVGVRPPNRATTMSATRVMATTVQKTAQSTGPAVVMPTLCNASRGARGARHSLASAPPRHVRPIRRKRDMSRPTVRRRHG